MLSSVLAWGWMPEIKGFLMVLIMFVVLVGSTYMIIGTNLGARLGFMIAAAGLTGWIFLMATIWWIYGIGLVGQSPSWHPVDVVRGDVTQSQLSQAKLLPSGSSKWKLLDESNPGRGQAIAAADEILVTEAKEFKAATEYQAVSVHRYGGQTYPKWFFNFWHKPTYAIVEVQPVVPQNTEPGKAPPAPVKDESAITRYVVMERDLGFKRLPAAMIALSSGVLFALTCISLHRRERLSAANRSGKRVIVPAPAD